MFSLICVWINGWENNREAGDLRRHRGHYDVNVIAMWSFVAMYAEVLWIIEWKYLVAGYYIDCTPTHMAALIDERLNADYFTHP